MEKVKVIYKCCVCQTDIILELRRQPLDIEILASYIGYIICRKCADSQKHQWTPDFFVEK